MQGLWSSHRKARLNLNNSAPLTPPSDLPSTTEEVPPTDNATQDLVASSSTSTPTAKRKLQSSKSVEGTISKRSKASTTSSQITTKNYAPPSTRLSDLGGVELCVEKMLELVAMPLCHPEVYLHTGVQPPRGVLLHGPPGCGKTLLAHAIAGVCIHTFSFPSLTDVIRSLVFRSSAYLLRL